MINLMTYYIKIKYEPKIKNYNSLTTKQKILHVTGPDAFSKAVFYTLKKNNKLLHRSINYELYFQICINQKYKQMYYINNRKHYSEYNEPLYMDIKNIENIESMESIENIESIESIENIESIESIESMESMENS
jgi:hypothetical protein